MLNPTVTYLLLSYSPDEADGRTECNV